MEKLKWVKTNTVFKEQRTTNGLYLIFKGVKTKYYLHTLKNKEGTHSNYEVLKGDDSITELKKFAQKHYNQTQQSI